MSKITLHGQIIKVGDRVWSDKYGWETVKHLDDGFAYPIITENSSYGEDGFKFTDDQNPSLFWKEQTFDFSKPIPVLKVDDKVLVRDNHEDKWEKRHFSHFNKKGYICTFEDGMTSWTSIKNISVFWRYWKLQENI